eukprot:scaffold160217_cov30-Tisochrysis_lutea.AAC.4
MLSHAGYITQLQPACVAPLLRRDSPLPLCTIVRAWPHLPGRVYGQLVALSWHCRLGLGSA